MSEAVPVVDLRTRLGESPLWSAAENAVYWIDIRGRTIHRWRYGAPRDRYDSWATGLELGSIGLASGDTLIAARRDGFHIFDPADGSFTPILDPEPDHPENRLNDGKVDRAGRFWCGSVRDPNPAPVGVLYRLDAAGRCAAMEHGISMPNALCWSPDNRTMYFADSFARAIWAYDFDLASGGIANRRVFVALPEGVGSPDGATVDAEGFVWNAHMRGGRVTRYAPDGSIDRVIPVPAAKVTCCAFGGPELSTLYVTTGDFDMTDDERRDQPLAGGLFAVETGLKGLPEPVFKR